MQRLTKPQKLIYDTEKFAGGSIAVVCGSILIKGQKDISALTNAVNEIFRLNDALRIRILEKDGVPYQTVSEYTEQKINVLRFKDKAELDLYAEKYAKEPIDFYGSLCDANIVVIENGYGLLVKLHHIISDAWTLSLIGTQFNRILNGETPEYKSYIDYIKSEDEYLNSKRYEKDKAYYIDQFKKCDEVTYISDKQAHSYAAERKTFIVDADKTARIVEYTKSHNTSVYMLLMTVLGVYVNRIKMNQEKFYIGTAVLNRKGKTEQNTMGMFINTVPLLVELENEKTFSENLTSVSDSLFSALRHQKFNYGDVLSALRSEFRFEGNLYDIMLSYQNAKIAGENFESTWYHSGMQTESLQIHIDDRDSEGILKIHYDYLIDKFSDSEINRMHEHIFNLLEDAISEDKKIPDLNILSQSETETLLYAFNDTKTEYPKDKCVHQLFEEQVLKSPDKTAVIACDKTLTYDELNKLSNRIANSLIEKGVKPNDIVVFALPRNSYLIPVMFGILKSGAAYMPIDPDYPKDRIDYMLFDSNAKFYITESNLNEFIADNEENPKVKITSDNYCYCIYTSGSTGKPKGTLLYHKGIINLISDLSIYKDLSSCKTFGFMTTITFDVATQEIFTALLHGFTGVLFPEKKHTDIKEIVDTIEKQNVDVVNATPSYFDALTSTEENAVRVLKALKTVALAGEKFYLNSTVQKFISDNDIIFENQYGPVELHVIATATTLKDNDCNSIGKPIANNQAYILDKYNNPMPIGQTGELCIAGDGVGAGYLNRPELTAEKFIDNPFGKGKLYKTGDLAYWREDGNIVYVGRNDFQVKIRGLRIELGEIENAICSVENILQAVVVVRQDTNGRQLICAFYTEHNAVDVADIKSAISSKLPKYMMPHIFTVLEEMPLTPSGKINRRALPEVDLTNISTDVEYIAPISEQEKILVAETEKILNADKVSVLDNFFDLGGDSLKAIELISKLESKGYKTTVKTVFDCENVKELAKQLEQAKTEITAFEWTGDIPATDAQMRVYTAQSMNENSTLYNVPFCFKTESVDIDRLQDAVNKLIERHESLRTHFENKDGHIIQVINDSVAIQVETLNSDSITDFIRPFDLGKAPLIRVGVYENTVMIDIHHIVTDGTSMPVFFNELNELYMDRSLNNIPVQYKEFTVEEQDHTESEKYWLSVFDDEVPVLEINTDYPRGQKQSHNGKAYYDSIDIELHNKIKNKCKELNITPYAFYMSGFNILLSKFSGNEDIVVGMPISGRNIRYLNTIGMFVNTIALRNKPVGTKTVAEFLQEVKENSISAIANQDYPFGELVKKLDIDAQNRNPLFDVMFAYQSEEMTDVTFADKKAELLSIPVTASKYDLTLNILPREKDVVLMAEYCADLYKKNTIRRIIKGYKQILLQMLNETTLIMNLSAITDSELNKLLYSFNDTKANYPKDKCVHQLFEEQVLKTPDKAAVIACDKTLTYDELNKLSNRIANSLIEKGVKANDIVAFALPRNSYLIPVMFGILKSGAAYMPIDPDYPKDRIDYMLFDSNAKFYITESNLNEFIADNEENPKVKITSDNYCYCIYTSGSTGKPKGTLLYHKGIINLISDLSIYKDLSSCKTFGFMTTITFDVATQEIFTALLHGFTGVLFPEKKHTDIKEIVDTIEKQNVDVVNATPSYFDALTSTEENAVRVLKALKTVALAGEKFYLNSTVQKFISDNDIIFENQYGPVELHVIATATTLKDNDCNSIGKPIANNQAYILDKYNNPMPIGQTGELCIAGDGVGAGYLNRPELTAEKFIDNPFGKGKLYKTGDLAYWREDGNIVYVGRNDFQVKIRGLRIELGEIENAICSVENILQAVVVVRQDTNGRQLICAFYTEHNAVDVADIKSAISSKLPKYMMPHIFTVLEEMPLTPSGKINRRALPEVDLTNISTDVEYIAPISEQEKILVAETEKILNADKVSVLDNFFDLGGDSLKAIELISKLESKGYKTTVKTVFDCENVKELAKQLEQAKTEITAFEWTGDIPATDAQMRVYTAQSMNENSTLYNVPFCFKTESVDIDRLQDAVNKLIERHESLRTHFENKDGHIIQVINDSVAIQVETLNSDSITDFIRPFDLGKAPLIRVGVYENTVMIDIHHIVTDGTSMPVFFNELNELYMDRSLNNIPVQYKEFTVEEQDHTESEKYWLSVFDDEVPVLEINTDYPRGQKQSHNGKAYYDSIDIELHNKIKNKCKELNITPYAFYMSGFNILLSKFSGNEDIVVGMPISGRNIRYLNTIGMFVNTIALRNKPVGTKTVAEFLQEVKENSISAIANQDYPFGELVKKLDIDAQNRNPLFDVMFAYQSEEMTDVTFADKKAELLSIPVTTSKYDLTLNVMPRENDVVLMAEYCTDLYKGNTIKRLADGFKQVLLAMLDNKMQIKDISAVSQQEKNTLLHTFNDTKADYQKDKCVHQLFEEQVLKSPDKTAVIACDKTLTYNELNKLSNRIANSLIGKGVKPNDIVAFALPRNSYLIPVMFGILKSGAAYLPIDLDFPQDRINYMLEDSGAKFFITEDNLNEFISDNEENPNIEITSDNNCYCIYTSGTTGKPKGTLIRHRNLMNFCDNNNNNNYQHCMINEGSRLISTFKCCFDAFGVDYALFLLNGLSLVLANDYEMMHAEDLARLIKKYNVDVIHSTPSTIKAFCGNDRYVEAIKKAKIIMVAAENFTPDLYEFLEDHTSAKFFNGYGPSETTIGVSFGEINSTDITIGKPIANTQIYIVDKYNNPMPMGQISELCIAGDGVGAGYLNRPELTAEKFIDNPFGEGKMYKTGDLAYWREDGNIAYVGRNDFQVKIRGLRIELGEIENAICSVEGVSQAVVTVRKDENGRQLICAFYTEKKSVELSEIKKAISDKLPKYMMPHIFTVLPEMPLTPSGKINRKALPEVDLSNISNNVEYVKPQTKLQKEIAGLMEKVLNYSPIGLEDDFFDLGGDSLKAIEFVSKAHNEGIYFNLQNVFDYPTVKYICECIENGNKLEVTFKDSDFTTINKILEKNKIENITTPQKTEVGNILLAGATGYLGIHILADFLDGDTGTAYCLVRGADSEDSKSRLKDLMEFYFGGKYNTLFDRRIVVLCADLQKEKFGLTDTKYDELITKVSTVINAAASVKHYGSYKYFYETNVETVNKLIEFCFKAEAKLIHTSTLSVSGNSFGDNFDGYISETEKHFYESSLYIEQPLENVYARSKFEAEKAVLDAMTKGLQANIMRMGNLTNRFSDLKFQRNHESNAFLNRVKAILDLGIFPDYLMDLYTEYTPIDDAANAIMRIARNFSSEQTVFHINSTKVVYMDKLIEYFNACGLNMQVVDGKTFTDALRKTATETGTEYIFETFINDMDENDKLNYDSNIRIENNFTVEYLRKLGFEWSDIDFEYIRKYIEYFRKIGYLEG